MKRIKILFITIGLFIANGAMAQLWKQYADSASFYNSFKKIDSAIFYYLIAKEELKKVGSITTDYIRLGDSLGVIYTLSDRFEEAKDQFTECRDEALKLVGKKNPLYATSCHRLGSTYYNLEEYKKAESFYLEAIGIRAEVLGKKHADYSASCLKLASLYWDMNELKKSEDIFKEVRGIKAEVFGKNHPEYLAVCDQLGSLYRDMTKYAKAEEAYMEAKMAREKLGKEKFEYAYSCVNLGIVYQDMGQYKKSEAYYLEAKDLREKIYGKESIYYESCVHNLGMLYDITGEYYKAEQMYLEALPILEKVKGKEHPNYANSCNSLANLYMNMGEYEKAESLYKNAIRIVEKHFGKKADYAGFSSNLGILYWRMGQLNRAESIFLEGQKIIGDLFGKEDALYSNYCTNLADVYADLGQYEKAESFQKEAKRIIGALKGKDHPEYASICNNLGLIYLETNQYDQALPLMLESKEIVLKTLGPNSKDYIENCEALGKLYQQIGQYDKAGFYFKESNQILINLVGKNHPNYMVNCNSLANFYWNTNQLAKSQELFMEAYRSQNIQIKKIFDFTSEVEQQAYLIRNAITGKYAFSFNTTAYSKSPQGFSYNVALSNRNLILTTSKQIKQAIYNTNDTSLTRRYNDWINKRQELSYWYAKPIVERPDYIKQLEQTANDLEKQLTSMSADFRKQHQKQISWKDVQANLKQDEAAIEFAEFNYYNGKRWTDSIYYIALVLRKDRPEPELVFLFEKKQLDSLTQLDSISIGKSTDVIRAKIKSLYTINGGDVKRSIYDIIWHPLQEKLTGIKTVYFSPAGSLHKISFAALPVNEKETLSDKFRLIQLNTTATVGNFPEQQISKSDNIMLYGGIEYDVDSITMQKAVLKYSDKSFAARSLPEDLSTNKFLRWWPFLDGTLDEINTVENLGKQLKYNVTVTKGIEASEESVKVLTGNRSPVILHIATHGFFFPDPGNEKKDLYGAGDDVFKQSDNPLIRSGLVMAGANNAWTGKPFKGIEDGIFTAYEVSNMYLPNTKLVVLSACETGLGDVQGSEGVYGLQRAFKMAGAKELIMSLWKVDDIAASEFMEEFYKNLFDGKSIDNAFYLTQNTMKKKYLNDPYKWAAWILVQ